MFFVLVLCQQPNNLAFLSNGLNVSTPLVSHTNLFTLHMQSSLLPFPTDLFKMKLAQLYIILPCSVKAQRPIIISIVITIIPLLTTHKIAKRTDISHDHPFFLEHRIIRIKNEMILLLLWMFVWDGFSLEKADHARDRKK